MYAIVEIAGQQFKVEKGKKIFVHRLEAELGKSVEFEKVLLIEENDTILVGEPLVDGYMVEVKVLDHPRGDKVIVFKKKRRKGYRVKNGHRQNFTQVEIISIGKKEEKKKAVEAKEEIKTVKQAVKKESAEEKKAAPRISTPKKKVESQEPDKETSAKKSTVKKAAAKKPAEKKSSGKKSPEGKE